jgi:hypothetical protein
MDKVVEFLKKIWNIIKNFFKKIKEQVILFLKKMKEKQILKKLKISIIKFFGYIGSCIGGIITKRKNINVSEELKIIDKKIEKIKNNYEKETEIVVIKMYKKEVKKTIKKLDKFENVSTREEEKKIKNKKHELEKLNENLLIYEDKLKDIEIIENPHTKEDALKSNEEKTKTQIVTNKIKETSKKGGVIVLNGSKKVGKTVLKGTKKLGGVLKKQGIKGGIVLKKGAIKTGIAIKKGTKKGVKKIALVTSTTATKISNNIKDKKQKKLEYKDLKNTVKEINVKINKAYTEIAKVKNSYSDTKLEELRLLKERVLDLKEDYIRLRNNKKFKNLKLDKSIENIDPNHLTHHGNAIYDLIDYLELTINEVKEGKIIKVEKTEIKEIKKSKEEPKEIPFDINDFNLVRESLKKDLLISQKELKKIKKEMNDIPIKYKKPTLLSRMINFFKLSMSTAVSLIPVGIFKNKLVATLTSGIILNNRIKAMKSMITTKETPFLDYEVMLDSIKDKRTCILNTGYVLSSTIDDIDEISNKLMQEYTNNPDALKLLKNLEEMKIDLIEENNRIDKMLQELKENQNKIKKKVA